MRLTKVLELASAALLGSAASFLYAHIIQDSGNYQTEGWVSLFGAQAFIIIRAFRLRAEAARAYRAPNRH
jgi:hypothetical protein